MQFWYPGPSKLLGADYLKVPGDREGRRGGFRFRESPQARAERLRSGAEEARDSADAQWAAVASFHGIAQRCTLAQPCSQVREQESKRLHQCTFARTLLVARVAPCARSGL